MQRYYPVVTLLVLAACSGANSSTDLFAGDGGTSSGSGKGGLGGLLNPGPTASDAGTDAATPAPSTTSTATPAAPAQACALTNLHLSPSNPCQACGGQNCCAELQACDGSNDCLALAQCANQCQGSDACVNECINEHNPGSTTMLVNINSCSKKSCAAQCE